MPNKKRAKIETALKEWVLALDTVQELIFMHDTEGRILRANRAYASRVGLDPGAVVGRYYWEVFPVMPGPRPLCPEALNSGGILVREVVVESGEVFISHGYPIVKSESGYLYSVHVLNDVTAAKRLEAEKAAHLEALAQANRDLAALNARLTEAQGQLFQSEKMAAIGALAAGVAHEINNPVGFLQSNLNTLCNYGRSLLELIAAYEQLEQNSSLSGDLTAEIRRLKAEMDLDFVKQDLPALVAESHEGFERVTQIVRDLKEFSQVDRDDKWCPEDLHRGLDSAINVAWSELKHKCEVRKEYGDLPPVECLLSQVNQVFLNLLINAAHAIDDRGVLAIRSGVDGDQVWVEVADNGCGIPPEDLKRIFEPFFTTRPVGKGAGLGLSVSYGIVQKHHGRIEVESELGKGSTFRVWLPVWQPNAVD